MSQTARLVDFFLGLLQRLPREEVVDVAALLHQSIAIEPSVYLSYDDLRQVLYAYSDCKRLQLMMMNHLLCWTVSLEPKQLSELDRETDLARSLGDVHEVCANLSQLGVTLATLWPHPSSLFRLISHPQCPRLRGGFVELQRWIHAFRSLSDADFRGYAFPKLKRAGYLAEHIRPLRAASNEPYQAWKQAHLSPMPFRPNEQRLIPYEESDEPWFQRILREAKQEYGHDYGLGSVVTKDRHIAMCRL